jgi:predicted metal-dependent hydrolase
MALSEQQTRWPLRQVRLGSRVVEYRLVQSKTAHRSRIRVGPGGIEVIYPPGRDEQDAADFLSANEVWVLNQVERIEQLRDVRRPWPRMAGHILLRGELTPVRVEESRSRVAVNQVRIGCDGILVLRGSRSRTPTERSLERLLRREARKSIEAHLSTVTPRLGLRPRRIYVMSQRTKWGNCSSRNNLSFNWRLIQAPEYVLRYIVTHEAVHLAVPDHSQKFWLTVQSLCRETEKARQWLCRYGAQLHTDFESVVDRVGATTRFPTDPVRRAE